MARPNAIIEKGKIINAEQIRRYWREQHHREYLLSRSWQNHFKELAEVKNENDQLSERISNLESISSELGRIPRAYESKLEQIQGQINYLQGKINENTSKKNTHKDRF